jgi:diguanylate cyclase (GGDEF)-like protein
MNITLAQAHQIFSNLDELIVLFSAEGEYKEIISSGTDNDKDEFRGLLGKKLDGVLSAGAAELFNSRIQECISINAPVDFEYQVAGMLNVSPEVSSETSNTKYYKSRLIPVADGSDTYVIWIAYDITQFKKLETNYKDCSIEDPVTGIYNRRFFFKELNSFYQRFQRGSNSYSVIMINLDHSEKLSDTYGIEVTEGMMSSFVTVIKNALRTTDLFASTGDEDFIILLPDTPSNGAAQMAERVRSAIENNIFELDGEQLSMTASFGCSEVAEADSSYDNVINRAEIALYQAKHNGGNCVNRLNYENWKK